MNVKRKQTPCHPARRNRKGAAAVEFALSVPLLFLVTWGCIEMTRYNLVKNVAIQAAFEAARIGVKPGATSEEIVAEAKEQMKFVTTTCDVDVIPSVITPATDRITVVIRIDTRDQGWVAPRYFDDPIMEVSFTIRRDNLAAY